MDRLTFKNIQPIPSAKATILNNIFIFVAKALSIKFDIHGIHEPVICEYFTRLNNGKFIATAELFAAQGCLNPPFDKQL